MFFKYIKETSVKPIDMVHFNQFKMLVECIKHNLQYTFKYLLCFK